MGHVVTPEQDAPPQNIDAEESVLGAMLVSQQALKTVRVESGLTPKHFYLDKHREIFAAICRVAERDGVADELLVAAVLPDHRNYLAELTAKVPAAGNAPYYARLVVADAQLRAKLEGGQMIQQGVRERHDEEKSAELIREGLQLASSDFTIEAEPTSGEEILDELFEHFDRDDEGEVFELPWSELNGCVLGGYRRKQMSVLAGWTNMGKSWVLDQIMAGFDAQGFRTAIFATEMSREERAARWLTSKTAVPLEKIMRNRLDQEDHRRLAKARAEANGRLPFDFYEAFGWSADRICERVIFGGYDIVAIDPIGRIPGFEKTEVASMVSNRLSEVAARANCHVIAVSHLNRNRLRDPNGVKPRPLCVDLRGSGSLETDAHAVLFLHRKQDEKANVLAEGELYFDKVRNGTKRAIDVFQSSRTLQFIPMTPDPIYEQSAMDLGRTNTHDRVSG